MKRNTAILSMGALLAGAAVPARAQALRPVRILATPLDPSGALFYAKDLGMFEKHGLEMTINAPNETSLAVPSLISNTVDFAYTNILATEQAFRKGIPIVMVAPAAVNDARRPTNFLMVAKNSPITTAAELEGKTLGTAPLKSLGDYSTNAWVEQHHADSSKLKWVEIPNIACADALERGRIDAAVIVEPYATLFRARLRLLGRPYESIGNRFLGAAYIASKEWAAANPDLVARFVATIREASVWGNQNPQKSAVILAKYTKVDIETVNAMTRSLYAETLVPEEIQPTIDFAAKYKFLDGTFPARDLIYRS